MHKIDFGVFRRHWHWNRWLLEIVFLIWLLNRTYAPDWTDKAIERQLTKSFLLIFKLATWEKIVIPVMFVIQVYLSMRPLYHLLGWKCLYLRCLLHILICASYDFLSWFISFYGWFRPMFCLFFACLKNNFNSLDKNNKIAL